MTVAEAIADGLLPTFKALCAVISQTYPDHWDISRADWIALQREIQLHVWDKELLNGKILGVPLRVHAKLTPA